MAMIAAVLGTALSAVGTLSQMSAQKQAGAQAQADAEYKAKQEAQQAQQSRASAQREAQQQERKTALTQSTLQARTAADGGNATDPTAVALGENIAGQGELNALGALYRGEDRATGLEMQAEATRAQGAAAKSAANAQATGTLISGASSMFSKFGDMKFG